ncbi:stress response translation initiation inhibitor YciH [Candidatus Micrarchaeota archaeon]|nr:stress response translation initiation inhibitor YciH [Candidatus Micrarchaeota archaeon]
MTEVCSTCGLQKTLCVCGQIEKEQQKIKVRTFRRRFGKIVTIVAGLENEKQAKELVKTLKRKLACGGTFKENEIELQGEHTKKVKQTLLEEGFNEKLIDA